MEQLNRSMVAKRPLMRGFTMIGPISWVDSLFIFPAAWMRLVVDAIREKSYMHIESTRSWALLPLLTNQNLC